MRATKPHHGRLGGVVFCFSVFCFFLEGDGFCFSSALEGDGEGAPLIFKINKSQNSAFLLFFSFTPTTQHRWWLTSRPRGGRVFGRRRPASAGVAQGPDSGALHAGRWAGERGRRGQTPSTGPACCSVRLRSPRPPPRWRRGGRTPRAPHGLSSKPGDRGRLASQAPGAASGPPRPASGVWVVGAPPPVSSWGEDHRFFAAPPPRVPGASKVPVALPGDSVAASSTRGLWWRQ